MSPLIHGEQTIDLAVGRSLFDYADTLRIRVPTSCERTGECHECIVEVKRGMEALSPLTDAEAFLRGNYRLACQATILNAGALVEFAVLRRQPRILTSGLRREIQPEPLTYRKDGGVWFDGAAGAERIDDYSGAICGIAVDCGTTTIVLNVVDLETGTLLHTASFENPQRFGGSDIMRRISYDAGRFHGELHAVMLSSINSEIGDICRRLGVSRRQIFELVVVGNATMRDLFFGVDVQTLGQKPYKSIVEHEHLEGRRPTTALNVKAGELGVRVHPKANVYGGPLIGAHVGADTAADLLMLRIDEETEPVMLVDVGTNTEVVVGNKDRLLAASCPAGPAFEGGEVMYGMPAYDGAVEKVRITSNGTVICETINNLPPQGICGSGLIDLLAELRRHGVMNELGVFAPGMNAFTFAPDQQLTLSRKDISALAQAKSANYCGQVILMRHYGLSPDKYAKLYLAGGFANYLDVDNALAIGFIANVPRERIVKVGDASLEGATVMLVSGQKRRDMEAFVQKIEHVELEMEPDFFDLFVEGCHFRPT